MGNRGVDFLNAHIVVASVFCEFDFSSQASTSLATITP